MAREVDSKLAYGVKMSVIDLAKLVIDKSLEFKGFEFIDTMTEFTKIEPIAPNFEHPYRSLKVTEEHIVKV